MKTQNVVLAIGLLLLTGSCAGAGEVGDLSGKFGDLIGTLKTFATALTTVKNGGPAANAAAAEPVPAVNAPAAGMANSVVFTDNGSFQYDYANNVPKHYLYAYKKKNDSWEIPKDSQSKSIAITVDFSHVQPIDFSNIYNELDKQEVASDDGLSITKADGYTQLVERFALYSADTQNFRQPAASQLKNSDHPLCKLIFRYNDCIFSHQQQYRRIFEEKLVEDAKGRFNKKTDLVYVSLASGLLFQDFVIIRKLIAAGFSFSKIIIIDNDAHYATFVQNGFSVQEHAYFQQFAIWLRSTVATEKCQFIVFKDWMEYTKNANSNDASIKADIFIVADGHLLGDHAQSLNTRKAAKRSFDRYPLSNLGRGTFLKPGGCIYWLSCGIEYNSLYEHGIVIADKAGNAKLLLFNLGEKANIPMEIGKIKKMTEQKDLQPVTNLIESNILEVADLSANNLDVS